jgi:hypothetical protein
MQGGKEDVAMEMNQLPIVHVFNAIQNNLVLAVPILLGLLALVITYYVLLIRAILAMLRLNARSVLLVFAFLALIPFPLVLIYGVMILITWRLHRRDLEAAAAG